MKRLMPEIEELKLHDLDNVNKHYIMDIFKRFTNVQRLTILSDASMYDKVVLSELRLANLENIKTLRVAHNRLKYFPIMINVRRLSCRDTDNARRMKTLYLDKFPALKELKVYIYKSIDCDMDRFPDRLESLKICNLLSAKDMVDLLLPNHNLKHFSMTADVSTSCIYRLVECYSNLNQLSISITQRTLPDHLRCAINKLACLRKLKINGVSTQCLLQAISKIETDITYLKIKFTGYFVPGYNDINLLSAIKSIKKLCLNDFGDGTFLQTGEFWPSLVSVGNSECENEKNQVFKIPASSIDNIERSLRYMSYFRSDVIYIFQKKLVKLYEIQCK
jgi:hypothetical protein